MTTQESASRAGTPSPAEAAGVRRAVILAAGKGERLRPLTDALPKCLVELNGEPLLLRSLRSLARQGIGEVVIVVGYKGELIRLRVGEQFEGMSVTYVDAPDYASTNNIRSLWEARAVLDCDLLLLEADLVFDDEVIASVLRAPASAAAVAPYHDRLSGTVVEQNGEGLVGRILLGAEQGDGFNPEGTFKTVNIYLLRRGLLAEQLLPRLEARIADGDVHDYYESVLRDCVSDGALSDLSAVDVSSARWWEVDDHRDLETASFLFLDRESQFDRIEELHGSY
ncbi:MAG: phosphocholine cytidylyltransferase family protein, partial [Chloroflexi bacterium]|nr:phosphocholine cytidylyltransferase family protein [Chloroflexota bacterium]